MAAGKTGMDAVGDEEREEQVLFACSVGVVVGVEWVEGSDGCGDVVVVEMCHVVSGDFVDGISESESVGVQVRVKVLVVVVGGIVQVVEELGANSCSCCCCAIAPACIVGGVVDANAGPSSSVGGSCEDQLAWKVADAADAGQTLGSGVVVLGCVHHVWVEVVVVEWVGKVKEGGKEVEEWWV